MKETVSTQKLRLNKHTIADLSMRHMAVVFGGAIQEVPIVVADPEDPTNCKTNRTKVKPLTPSPYGDQNG